MSRLEVAINSGAQLQLYQAVWGPLYEAVLSILGSTGVILPLGDPKHGQPNATTFATVGEEQVTFTWSEAPASFDTPLDLTDPESFRGIVPAIDFNRTDEEADTPDADYWSSGADGTTGNEPAFSMGAWINLSSVAGNKDLLSGFDQTTGSTKREWRFYVDGDNLNRLEIWDESAGARIGQKSPALATGVPVFVVATYDASRADGGIKTYVDGSDATSAASGSGSYTAMENTAAKTTLGYSIGASASQGFFGDKLYGGPLGLFFTQTELTADQVLRLYELGRRALGL